MPPLDMRKSQDSASDPPATAGAETNVVLFDLRALARFDVRKPYVVTLTDTGTTRQLLISFRAGQALPPQELACEVSAQALRGRLRLRVGASSSELIMGHLAQVEAHTPFHLTALTDVVALLSLTPSPGEAGLSDDLLGDASPLVLRAPGDAERVRLSHPASQPGL